jgi:glycosyltransferase involved in cell wall biosynthesis
LVPPRDPEPLAAAISQLLAAPERWATMGAQGRAVVEEHFSARAMVRQMEALYADTLQQRGRTRSVDAAVAVG